MNSRKPEKAKSKPGRKKLTLSKETLKDLTTKDSRAKDVRGAAKGKSNQPGCYSEGPVCSF